MALKKPRCWFRLWKCLQEDFSAKEINHIVDKLLEGPSITDLLKPSLFLPVPDGEFIMEKSLQLLTDFNE